MKCRCSLLRPRARTLPDAPPRGSVPWSYILSCSSINTFLWPTWLRARIICSMCAPNPPPPPPPPPLPASLLDVPVSLCGRACISYWCWYGYTLLCRLATSTQTRTSRAPRSLPVSFSQFLYSASLLLHPVHGSQAAGTEVQSPAPWVAKLPTTA